MIEPVFEIPFVDVTPVTPSVPPTVSLPVTDAEASVARPLVVSVAVEMPAEFVIAPVFEIPLVDVTPVTPSVPPMVVALVPLPIVVAALPVVLMLAAPV